MKKEIREKNRCKETVNSGKHSGSVSFDEKQMQNMTLSDLDLPASIRNQEMKKKRYRHKEKAAILFCVDGSRSQGSRERLAFAKSAVLAILEKAYSERDRVGMILFGNSKAELILPYTKSVDFAAEKMKSLSAKGNTPLSMAIRLAEKTVEQDRKKNKEDIHIIVLLTDGKSNFDSEEGKPLKLAEKAAESLRNKKICLLVVDTENSVFSMGLAKKLADKASGKYVKI